MAESDSQPAYNGHHSEESLPALEKNGDQQSKKEASDAGLEDAEKAKKPPPNPWMDPKSFPEGGAKAWLTVAGSSACLFVSFGWVNCVGVFQEYYQTHQLREYTASDISWIPALQSRSSSSHHPNFLTMLVFFMLFGGTFVGKLFDNYGPRYLLLVGTFLHVFGLMMTSISTKYYQILLSQAICSPIGASMVFYPAFTCVSSNLIARYARRSNSLGINLVL